MGDAEHERRRGAKAIAAAVVSVSASVALFMIVSVPVTVPAPVSVPAPVLEEEATGFAHCSEAELAEKRWNALYREIARTPQSMIGGFAASDSALDEFLGPTRSNRENEDCRTCASGGDCEGR